MKTKNYHQRCSWLFLLTLTVLFTAAKAQDLSSPEIWSVKVNLMSPVWKNVSMEAEYMPWNRVSIFVTAGLRRSHEDVATIADLGCTQDKGYGVAGGAKYFFLLGRSGTRTVNGLALKTSVSYNLRDQVRQTCPSLLPMILERTNAVGLNAFAAFQRTFWDRVTLEAQAGLGYSLESVVYTSPEPLAEIPNETRSRLTIPFGLYLGVVF